MDTDVAVVVVAAITAAGAVVWLIALRFVAASARADRAGQPQTPEEVGAAGEGRVGWLTGGTEVEGEPSILAARAVAILAKGSLFAVGTVKVLEKDDQHIRFERADAGVGKVPASQWFRRGELRFTPLRPGRTRVEWAVEPADMRWLLWLGALFQAAGLTALVVGCWLLSTRVASSPNPAVRWQVFQMLQAVHFLWPPFLFAALYRRGTRAVAAQFEALANNLPYYDG
jgi:hypothetical protein